MRLGCIDFPGMYFDLSRIYFFADANGNLDPEAPPANYGRRRSRAVLYQLSGHYRQDKPKTKIINNVSTLLRIRKRNYDALGSVITFW